MQAQVVAYKVFSRWTEADFSNIEGRELAQSKIQPVHIFPGHNIFTTQLTH